MGFAPSMGSFGYIRLITRICGEFLFTARYIYCCLKKALGFEVGNSTQELKINGTFLI